MANTGTVWAFDLGKGSIGEAVRLNDKFLHKASSPCRAEAQRVGWVIPAEFVKNKPGEDYPRRVCLRNAFEQVYPHGG
jgi:hypothetical protein